MSESKNPRPPRPQKLSAFALAKETANIQAEIDADDVLHLKPDWNRQKAEAFLRQHTDVIGREMVVAGATLLMALIEGSEHVN